MHNLAHRLDLRHQRGIGLFEVLFILAVAGFLLTVGMKLGPHYMEYLSVKSLMEDLAQDAETVDGGKMRVVKSLEKRLYINGIETIDLKAFTYKKTREGYRLSVDYQVQEHLFANVDAVLSFNHEAVAVKP